MIGTTTTVKVLAGLFATGLLFFAIKGPEQPQKAQAYSSKNIRLDKECLSKLRDTAYQKSGQIIEKMKK